jgi:exopolysaccharide biosynthesis polyprenyl glycosylphosphotransferase
MSAVPSLLRRKPLTRRHLEQLDPQLMLRDLRARTGPIVSGRLALRALGGALNVLVLAAIDLGAVGFSLYAGLVARELIAGRSPLWGVIWQAPQRWMPFIGLVVLLVFAKNGLYRRVEGRPGGGRIVSSLALSTLVIAVYAIGTDAVYFHTYAIFAWTFVLSAMLVPLLRRSYELTAWMVMRALGVEHRAVICGEHGAAAAVEAALADDVAAGARLRTVARVARIEDLGTAIREHRPHDVILARPPEDADLLDAAEDCRRHGVRLRVVPSAANLLAREAVYVPGQPVPLFEIRPPTIQGVDWAVKRTFDLVVSALLLILLAPLLGLIALLVRSTSPGGVLYRDERIGVGERPFQMLKFRSMRAGADREQELLEEANEAGGAIFKLRDDPRVTRVGRVLRRYSLDELPQLVNVLRGQMSLAGPRPLPRRDYDRLQPWHRKRYLVLPGITGLWQISGRSNLGFDDMVRLDFYYLEHWSIWLDIAILARTPLAVVLGRGAF